MAAVLECDLLITDGSITCCAAAIAAAQRGVRVVLADRRIFFGHELTATLLPWVGETAGGYLGDTVDRLLPEPVAGIIEPSEPTAIGAAGRPMNRPAEIRIYREGELKRALITAMIDAGIRLLPGFTCVSDHATDSDRQLRKVSAISHAAKIEIQAGAIVHPGISASAAIRAPGGEPTSSEIPGISGEFAFGVEYLGVELGPPDAPPIFVSIPHDLGTLSDSVTMVPDPGAPGRALVVFTFHCHSERSPILRAQRVATQVSLWLKHNDVAFERANLSRFALEALPLDGGTLRCTGTGAGIDVLDFSRAPVELPRPFLASMLGSSAPAIQQQDSHFPGTEVVVSSRATTFDVAIVGGGTAGAAAAIGAARQGAAVVLVEEQPFLGGTGTVGGINRYYYGNRGAATLLIDRRVAGLAADLSEPLAERAPAGGHGHNDQRINITVKEQALRDWLEELGVTIVPSATVLRTEKTGNTLSCIRLLSGETSGILDIYASVFIDATGNADIAVMAGEETVSGDVRDGNTQTFNLCDWRNEDERIGVNLDRGVLDVDDPLDCARAATSAQLAGREADNSSYIAPRESRHIVAERVFSLADVFGGIDDAEAFVPFFTDYDQHALQSSWFARLGLLPYHRDTVSGWLPMRTVFPRDTINLLVTGKAIAATRDAACFVRMQPDMQNLGYATGVLAAIATERHCAPTQVSAEDVRAHLARQLAPYVTPPTDTFRSTDTSTLVSRVAAGDPPALARLLVRPAAEVGELLRARLGVSNSTGASSGASAGRPLLAVAAAWFRLGWAPPILRSLFDDYRHRDQSPGLDANGRPFGGIVSIDDVYWIVNSLVAAIGIVRDEASVPILADEILRTEAGSAPVSHERFHWGRVPNYDRIVNLCFAAERIGAHELAAPLATLLSKEHIGGYVSFDPRAGDQTYPGALLELIVARACARCGGAEGYGVLITYLDDSRALLRNHARRELEDIAGGAPAAGARAAGALAAGALAAEWSAWLERQKKPPVAPYLREDLFVIG